MTVSQNLPVKPGLHVQSNEESTFFLRAPEISVILIEKKIYKTIYICELNSYS